MPNLRDFTLEALEEYLSDQGQPPWRARQIFRWLARGAKNFEEMTDLPKALRRHLAQTADISLPRLTTQEKGADGTIKLALRLSDGALIETVIIPERDHYTLCLSSQVGCAMGCAFCLTAKMGFRRNLSPGEITGQIILAREILGEEASRLTNLVFMGMGEPLANYEALLTALRNILHPLGFGFSKRRVTVSTSGLVPQLLRLSQEIVVKLAISLHAPEEGLRSQLMPVNRTWPLKELLSVCRRLKLPRGWRITFEYLLLEGINDSRATAQKLAWILRGIPAKINLIPFNPAPGLPFRCPSEERILAFQAELLKAGYTTIIRKSKGRDISAACGQLYARVA
ncbi:MAG TPA: 23S rRNA (adenine(2503)-C(2))-methyltransferase RlmN [Thermodesulfatator sp.]|nr:23S rRNA (adenine(2503)-C(2))-methyltransferase RlmN [Thermodesulfatator sp.]